MPFFMPFTLSESSETSKWSENPNFQWFTMGFHWFPYSKHIGESDWIWSKITNLMVLGAQMDL